MPRYVGPFEMLERIGAVAYRLRLPDAMRRIHDVFHVSLLRPYRVDGSQQPPPLQIEVDGTAQIPLKRFWVTGLRAALGGELGTL